LPQSPSPGGNQKTKEPVCFEVPSNYEITVDGKKLVGSAQARKKFGVLQHGTLPLYGDLARITQVLAFAEEEKREQVASRLVTRATNIEIALKKTITWEAAADSFINAFQEALNLEFQTDELSTDERSRADELVKEKYAHPKWTERI
jgi:lipoate-protein ligase A